MRGKLAAVTVVLTLAAGMASAQIADDGGFQYISYNLAGGQVFFVEAGTLARSGDEVTAWVYEFKDPAYQGAHGPEPQRRVQFTFNCARRTTRLNLIEGYSETGDALTRAANTTVPASAIAANTLPSAAADFACDGKKPLAEAPLFPRRSQALSFARTYLAKMRAKAAAAG